MEVQGISNAWTFQGKNRRRPPFSACCMSEGVWSQVFPKNDVPLGSSPPTYADWPPLTLSLDLDGFNMYVLVEGLGHQYFLLTNPTSRVF